MFIFLNTFFLPVIPSWICIGKWIIYGDLISCDSLAIEVATDVYFAGLETKVMAFSHQATNPSLSLTPKTGGAGIYLDRLSDIYSNNDMGFGA